MRRWLLILLAATAAVGLLAATTFAALIGFSAECTGSTADCPRSDAYRGTLLAMPLAAGVMLVAGAAWSFRRRSPRPLVLAEAGVLALAAIVGSFLGTTGIGTVVLLLLAFVIGRAALSSRRNAVRLRDDHAPHDWRKP